MAVLTKKKRQASLRVQGAPKGTNETRLAALSRQKAGISEMKARLKYTQYPRGSVSHPVRTSCLDSLQGKIICQIYLNIYVKRDRVMILFD